MTLRILGGKFRGRPLKTPKGETTRPTTSLVKKAVFDMLRPHLEGASFLDLFSGSGSMGFEALSQGASDVTFIESHQEAIKTIKANIASLDVAKETHLICKDVLSSLPKLKSPFEIIYVDPPYKEAHYLLPQILSLLDNHHLCTQTVLLEEPHPGCTSLPHLSLSTLKFNQTRRYGVTLLHLFESELT